MIRSIFVVIALISILFVTGPGQVFSDSGMALNMCQELVNNARNYESRATWHNRVCKNLMQQIENMSKQPKNSGTSQALETLFSNMIKTGRWKTSFGSCIDKPLKRLSAA